MISLTHKCPSCGGDGIETCHNPDHGFIDALSFHEVGRLGCPVCGHDPKHKVKYKGQYGQCEHCNGIGRVSEGSAIEILDQEGIDNCSDDYINSGGITVLIPEQPNIQS